MPIGVWEGGGRDRPRKASRVKIVIHNANYLVKDSGKSCSEDSYATLLNGVFQTYGLKMLLLITCIM